MNSSNSSQRVFTLNDAQELLPTVQNITGEAVRQADQLASQLHDLDESDLQHSLILAQLNKVINAWTVRIQSMDLQAKGMWLVDFDNGEGYYCWSYPEASITHFHSYEDGFTGRMKIV